MARNPITSESLTVDFKQLMRIPVGSRIQAASLNSDFLASILTLTPSQIAQAFPDYYKRQLPDVSNFITANIQAKLSGRGQTWNQTGGGALGTSPGSYYTEEGKLNPRARPAGAPKPTVDEMKKELLKNGINVDNVYNVIDEKGILANDKRIEFLKNLSKEDLAKAGLEKIETEDGKSLIRETVTQAAQMTDEQVVTELKKKSSNAEGTYRPVYPLSEIDLSDAVVNTIAGEALAGNKESIDGVINNMLNRVGADPNWNNLKDVARAPKQYAGYRVASDEQAAFIRERIKELASGKVPSNIGAATEFRAEYYVKGEGYGKTFEREARKQGYLQPGPGDNIYAETFAAGPYAPRKQEEVEKIKTENAAKMNKAYTPEEIRAAKQKFIQEEEAKRQAALTEALYGQASPTSSQSIPDKSQKTNVNIGPLEDPYEFWAARNPNNAVLEHNGRAIDREYLMTAMMAAKKFEAENPTKRVELYGPGAGYDVPGTSLGGTRDSGQHLKGNAGDWAIYDIDPQTGQKLKNQSGAYGNYSNKPNHGGIDPEGFALYNEFIQNQELARIYKANQDEGNYGSWGIRNGMLFSDVEWDAMHSDKGGTVDPRTGISAHASPIGRGSVAEGLSESALAQLGIDPNSEAGQRLMTGVAERFGTGEDLIRVAEESYGPKKDPVVSTAELEEQQNAAAKPPSEIPKLALGGSLHGLNEDMTLVETESGQPIAQIGHNERFEKQGNAVQVTPETKLKADELTDKYDISDIETQISEVEERLMQQQQNNQMNQKPREPERIKNEPDQRWHEMSAQISPLAPPYERAIARAKFLPEGYHYGRGMHSSIT